MKTKNKQLLEEFNSAFARNDTDLMVKLVTDNIKWTAMGEFTVEGKDAFTETLKRMQADEPWKLVIDKIITHGKDAAVNGVMTSSDGKQYAFCDVYQFSGFKDPKIDEMTSYVVEMVAEDSPS